jgi:hypothetical protein
MEERLVDGGSRQLEAMCKQKNFVCLFVTVTIYASDRDCGNLKSFKFNVQTFKFDHAAQLELEIIVHNAAHPHLYLIR